MTPPSRHYAAAAEPARNPADIAWQHAVDIRGVWLDRGLATQPADRPAAEQSLTNLYARLGRPRPRFEWVDSPREALPLVKGFPTHDVLYDWVMARHPRGKPPFASDLAASLTRLRSALDESIAPAGFDRPPPKRKPHERWPVLAPRDALDAGIPFLEILRQGVRACLHTSLADGLYLPLRAALATSLPLLRVGLPVVWYGQQESHWIAYYDVCRRLGLGQYTLSDDDHLNDWASLACSSGWWWPGEDTCVVVERTAVIRTEEVPGAWHGQVRLRHGVEPAVEFRDGWCPPLLANVGPLVRGS